MKAAAIGVLSLACAVACSLSAQATDGPKLSISPIRLTLQDAGRSQTVAVVNGGDEAVDIAVGASAWSQSDGVPLGLSESKDLLVFPRTLHIAPHEQGLVRVGIVNPLGSVEQAYRLAFTQVTDPDAAPTVAIPGVIAMHLRITMPVFVAPTARESASQIVIEDATLGAHTADVRLRNAGAVHAIVPSVTVEALDAAGTRLGSAQVSGWYVLANSEQSFSVPVSETLCQRATQLAITVRTDDGKSITKTIASKLKCVAH